MTTINLLHIIRKTKMLETIWKQYLHCTEDCTKLFTLFDAYTQTILKLQHSLEDNGELDYQALYDDVIDRYESYIRP